MTQPPRAALFEISTDGRCVKWFAARHGEALAEFLELRIRPRCVSRFHADEGISKWSAIITWSASQKLRDRAFWEAIL